MFIVRFHMVVLFLVSVLYVLFVRLYDLNLLGGECKNWTEIRDVVWSLNEHGANQCSSDICSDIIWCPASTIDWFKPKPLFSLHANKDVVIPITFKGNSALIKTTHIDQNLLDPAMLSPIESQPISPANILLDWVIANYAPFVPELFHQYISSLVRSFTDLQRWYGLLMQDEFLFLSLLPFLNISLHHFPKLYGVCENTYVVERLPEVINENFVRQRSWEEIMPVIISFIELATHIDSAKLELCDVQFGNFGWNNDENIVKVIDLDSIFFRELLQHQLVSRKCSSDDDCRIFDCTGQCNFEISSCGRNITNNNLSRICVDMFRPAFYRLGLFSAAPLSMKPKLFRLLDRCTSFGNTDDLDPLTFTTVDFISGRFSFAGTECRLSWLRGFTKLLTSYMEIPDIVVLIGKGKRYKY